MCQAAPQSFVESDHEFFELTGPLPLAWDEHRRFPRFYLRACADAVVHPLRGELDSVVAPCILLTRDLSRGGMSLIHTEQLFPGQRLDLTVNNEPPRMLEVAWCRRWTAGRYVVGCKFIAGSPDDRPAPTQLDDSPTTPEIDQATCDAELDHGAA